MSASDIDLAQIERQLREELTTSDQEIEQLEDQVRDFGENSELAEGADNHPGDDADRMSEQQRLLTIRGELAARKSDIENALGKVDDGTFGICERCGQQIAPGRLEALPFVRFCVECQEIVDREGAAAT